MSRMLLNISESISRRWCHMMHPGPMWPIHGTYQCPSCHRKYPIPWENQGAPAIIESAPVIRGAMQSPNPHAASAVQ